MSQILWILPLVGGLSRYIGEFKKDREDSKEYSFNSNLTKSNAVKLRPEMSVSISAFPKVDAKFGQNLALSCRMEDHPLSSFTWHQAKGETEVLRGNSSSLKITSISYADSGQWRCLASNKEGNWTSKPTELQVFGPPSSLSAPGKVVGRVGEKLEITASFCCHPAARVDWVVGHTTLVNKEDIGRITFTTKDEQDSCYSSTLTFNRLLVSDSGEVVVEVANSEGGQRRNIIIQVVENQTPAIRVDESSEDESAVAVVAGELASRNIEEEQLEELEVEEKLLVEMVDTEAETPMEVIASLWVGGVATLALILLVVLQVISFMNV